MERPKFFDESLKDNISICPHCGILFDRKIKGESESLWDGFGVFCPVCGVLAVPKKDQEDEKEKTKKDGSEMLRTIIPIIVLSLLFLNGCATTPMQTPNPKDTSLILPEQIRIEGIKIERGQSFTDCVPVALEAIFRFYGKSIDRKEIDEKVHKSWGTYTKDWVEYVKSQGFNVYSFYDRSGDKRGIKFFLAQHLPVLVIGGGSSWQSHVVVVIGYDDAKRIFYVTDPGWRAIQQYRYLDFDEWHRRQNSYGFVVYPASQSIEKLK